MVLNANKTNYKNKIMKKLILTLGIFLSGVLLVQAQSATASVDKKTSTLTGKITKACNLTSDQVTKVTPFIAQFVQTRTTNMQKFANDPTNLKTANHSNAMTLKTNLKTVLSDAQMAQYTAMVKRNMAAHPAANTATPAAPAQK